MRWRRTAFWATFGILALAMLTFGWLWTADLGVFKPQLERFVTQKTGRAFVIDGELSVDLAGSTTIIAEGVRFANPDWAGSDDMATIGRAEVRIALWSLFHGPVLIELIDLDDTNIQLLNPGDKAPNWTLPVEAAPENDANSRPGAGVLIRQIDIDHLQVSLESVRLDRQLNLVVERFDQAHRQDDYLDLSVRGALDGRTIEIDGEFGTWSALRAGKNFAVDIDAMLDTLTISARGRVDDIARLRRPELEIAASAPDIDHVTQMLGLGAEGEGDIRLSGSLEPIEDGPLVMRMEGNFGRTEIDLRGQVADLQGFGDIQLQATASGSDFIRFLPLGDINEISAAPFLLDIDAETRGGAFIVSSARMDFADAKLDGSATLPNFPRIDDAVVSLQVEGRNIERFRFIPGMPGKASGPFSLGFSSVVRGDGAEIVELDASTPFGEFRGRGLISDPDTLLGTQFNFQARTDSLSRLAAAYGIDGLPDRSADITGAAEYTAAGIRTDGPITLVVDGNTAEAGGIVSVAPGFKGTELEVKAAGDDFSHLVGLFAPAVGLPALPFAATAKLRAGDDGLRLKGIEGAIGNTSVSGDGLVVPAHRMAGSWFNVAARGDEFEELFASLPDLRVRPGPFQLDGRIELGADVVDVRDGTLDRDAGHVRADLVIGVGRPEPYFEWNLAADGEDIGAIVSEIEGFEASGQPFSLATRGILRGTIWAVDTLDLAVGESTLTATGDFALRDATTATSFHLALFAPSLAAVGTIDGRKFADEALSASATVTGDGSMWWVRDLDLRIGESDIQGTVSVRKGDVPDIEIQLDSDRLLYDSLFEAIEEDTVSQREFADGRLIPDTPIPFEALRKANVSVAANIDEFRRGKVYLSDATLDATVRDGVADIHDFRFKARSGQLVAKARLAPDSDPGGTMLEVVGRDLAFGLAETNLDLATTIDLDANLRSSGTTLRALAGNTNGVVYVDIRGGRSVQNSFIQAIYGDTLQEIVNAVNPFRETDPYTDLECVIVPLTVTDGQVTGAPSVFMSTGKIRLVMQGEADLKSEKLELSVRTTPRRILSISAAELVNPYVKIKGTLASPRLAIDEAGVMVSGGAAVATGGLSVVARGLWDRLSKSGDACGQAAAQARRALDGRMPDIVLDTAPQAER